MVHTVIELLGRSWPVGFVVILCGIVYCVLLCLFCDAIEAADEFTTGTGEGGPLTLFLITSLLLGWGTVAVLEYRLGVTGSRLWVIALPWWAASIGGGFAAASFLAGRLPAPVSELCVLCAVSAGCTGAYRIYFSDIV